MSYALKTFGSIALMPGACYSCAVRVLAVGNMYPPHHLGGYELVWRSAMRHLRACGHTARVLTADFRTATTEEDEPDTHRELRWYWHDHEWPPIEWRERVRLERHNAEVLDRHLAQLEPDVVSWWSMGGMSLSLLERVRRTGIPAVAFVADDWLLYAPQVDRWTASFRRSALAARAAERLTGLPARVDLDACARYVLISEAVRRAARAAGLRLAGSEIAHLGVDPAFLDPRPEHAWGWRLLYVGRIDERKGVADAIAALAALAEPQAMLTIAGDGDAREVERIVAAAGSLGVADRVQMLGMRSHAELPAIYEACDVVLFPVRWQEPWGIVPLEAMAFGRPVVATGLGGSGEYLRDGENCLIVPERRPDQLAAAVRRLHAGPQLRGALRTGGVATAARHTEPVFNAAVEAALAGAVSHRGAAIS
jgi:glycosyltransferase involved in cell wall biosynthesis